MRNIHTKLCHTFRVYQRWHTHPHHQHHHWLVAFLASLVGAYAIAGAWQVSVVEQELLVRPVAMVRAAVAGTDNLTFASRADAYLSSLPAIPASPTPNMTDQANRDELDRRVDSLFGWLERCATDPAWSGKCKIPVVTETIQYFVRGYWMHPGPKVQAG